MWTVIQNGDLVNLNSAENSFDHTVLRTKFTELQEPCRCAEICAALSTIDVFNFALARVSAPVAGETLYNDALQRTAGVSELQMMYDRHVLQMVSVKSERGTSRPLAHVSVNDIMHLGALFDTCKDGAKLL